MTSKPVRYCIYLRVSTQNQVRLYDDSLDNQEKQTKALVESLRRKENREWIEVDIFRDAAQSGTSSERPLYKKMQRGIIEGKYDAIVTYEMSRLYRSMFEHVYMIGLLKMKGVELHVVHGKIDFQSADGNLQMDLKAAFDAHESSRVSERVSNSILQRSKDGKWNGGSVLFGFRRNLDRKSHILVDEEAANAVRFMFDKYLELGSYKLVAEIMNRQGLIRKGRKKAKAITDEDLIPDRQWTVNTVRGALSNRAYLGQREINKKGRRPSRRVPIADYQVVKAVWPAIITEEVFQAVQKKISENTKVRHNTSATFIHTYLLRGVAHCPHCETLLQPGGTQKESGKYYHYYRHPVGIRKKDCPLVSGLDAERLEALVLQRIDSLANNGALLKGILERTKKDGEGNIPELHDDLRLQKAKLEKAYHKIRRLTDHLALLETSSTDVSLIIEQLAELKLERDATNQHIAELEQQIESEQVEAPNAKDIAVALRQARSLLEGLNPGDRQELMSCLVRTVSVYEKQVEIEFIWGKRWIAHLTSISPFTRGESRSKNNTPTTKFVRSVDWLPGEDSNLRPID